MKSSILVVYLCCWLGLGLESGLGLGLKNVACYGTTSGTQYRGMSMSMDRGRGRGTVNKAVESDHDTIHGSAARVENTIYTTTTTTTTTTSSTSTDAASLEKQIRQFAALGAAVLTIAAGVTVGPGVSHASYGSGGASVSSFPEIETLSVEEYLKLSSAKQKQRQSGTSCVAGDKSCEKNVDRLLKDFRSLEKQSILEEEQYAKLEGRVESRMIEMQKDMDTRKKVEEQLQDMSAILIKLQAQPPWVSYGAAALGSILSTLIMHPLDTIKVNVIVASERRKKKEEDLGLVSGGKGGDLALPAEESAAFDFGALYAGIIPNIIKEAPASALYLGVYEAVRTALAATVLSSNPLLIYLLSGAAGEFVGSMLRAPAEAIKLRIQTADVGTNLSLGEAARRAFLTPEGRATTYISWTASLLRDVPMGAIQLALFESLKTYVINSPNIDFDVGNLAAEALFGAIGGFWGAILTTPGDVLTTIIVSSAKDGSGRFSGKSIFEVLPIVVEEQGIKGLFKGAAERGLYWAPAISIFLTVYCSLRQYALVAL